MIWQRCNLSRIFGERYRDARFETRPEPEQGLIAMAADEAMCQGPGRQGETVSVIDPAG